MKIEKIETIMNPAKLIHEFEEFHGVKIETVTLKGRLLVLKLIYADGNFVYARRDEFDDKVRLHGFRITEDKSLLWDFGRLCEVLFNVNLTWENQDENLQT